MGRGLSKLQRTILEMAYERFREAMDEYEAKEVSGYQKGARYKVYVGPALPSDEYVAFGLDFPSREQRVKQRLARNPCESLDEARAAVDAEDEAHRERIGTTRREVEEKVRAAAPELWDKPEDNHYYWSPPDWSYVGKGAEGISYQRFEVASFSNNTAEARRYEKLLTGKGLPWTVTWHGGGIAYTGEVLEKVYGFEPKYKLDTWREWPFRDGIKFDPETIGPKRYNAARASVSRALKRLYDRMLIELSYGSAMITLEGIAELTGQTVNEVCIAYKINRTDGDRRLLIRGEEPYSPEEIEASSAAVESLQNALNPPPRPLADQFLNAIELHLLGVGEATEEEIREAFEEGLARAKELCEGKTKAVNDSGNQENVSRYAETKA